MRFKKKPIFTWKNKVFLFYVGFLTSLNLFIAFRNFLWGEYAWGIFMVCSAMFFVGCCLPGIYRCEVHYIQELQRIEEANTLRGNLKDFGDQLVHISNAVRQKMKDRLQRVLRERGNNE